MGLHPQIAQVIAAVEHPEGRLNPVAMRAAEEAGLSAVADRPQVFVVEDRVADGVPVRIYSPSAQPAAGVIVYLHGGAFFLGSLETHDHVARSLSLATEQRVVSVGYRLAPEHAFPAGLNDCATVARWVTSPGGRGVLAWDDGDSLIVAGDSSGATFAAVVAAQARDDGFAAITHQVLYYPSLDLDFDSDRYESLRTNARGYGMETAGLKPFNDFYLRSGADPDDPRVSPIKRRDLSGLPPALILTAEFDPLRDEGELYAQRLEQAGVRVELTRYGGAGHGFVQHFGWLPEYGRALTQTAEFMR